MHRLSLQCELPAGGTGLYSSPSPRHPTYCRDLINSSCLSSQKCWQLQRPLMGPRQSQTLTSPTTQKEARKRWMDIKELEVSHQDRVPPVCKAPDRTSQRKSSCLCHRQIKGPPTETAVPLSGGVGARHRPSLKSAFSFTSCNVSSKSEDGGIN